MDHPSIFKQRRHVLKRCDQPTANGTCKISEVAATYAQALTATPSPSASLLEDVTYRGLCPWRSHANPMLSPWIEPRSPQSSRWMRTTAPRAPSAMWRKRLEASRTQALRTGLRWCVASHWLDLTSKISPISVFGQNKARFFLPIQSQNE